MYVSFAYVLHYISRWPKTKCEKSTPFHCEENLEFNSNYSRKNWLYFWKRIVKSVVNKCTMLLNWQGIKRPLMESFLKMFIFVIPARCFSNIQEIWPNIKKPNIHNKNLSLEINKNKKERHLAHNIQTTNSDFWNYHIFFVKLGLCFGLILNIFDWQSE